ncbi:MAG: hypothetical protein ACOY5Y_05660 [Pseudomonadota bacterium]
MAEDSDRPADAGGGRPAGAGDEEDSDRPEDAGGGRPADPGDDEDSDRPEDPGGGRPEGTGEDSDRPDWAGEKGGKAGTGGGRPPAAGTAKGDIYGDLYVILRDANGVPILNEDGFVQPLDASGNLIPLDEEGAPIDESLVVEADLGRLNSARSPSRVLDQRSAEVIDLLNSADAVTLDAAGRLVVTADGVTKTIDSPLENMAIYVALMTEGTIPGVSDLPGTALDHLVDGEFTSADLVTAKSFLAAAADKTNPLTTDDVAYINKILEINLQTVGEVSYSMVDFSSYTYDRSSTYEDVTATVLVLQPDGSYKTETVNVFDYVFKSVDYTGNNTLSAFATAADDARTVINVLHEAEIPDTTATNPTSRTTDSSTRK